jgi:hypothetical protein
MGNGKLQKTDSPKPTMNTQEAVEAEFRRFLANPAPKGLDEKVARSFLEHVADCAASAQELRGRPIHAELLVEAGRPTADVDPRSKEIIIADQLEARQAGEAALQHLKPTSQEKRELGRELGPELQAELWTLNAEPQVMRAALAASELSLSISGFLSSERRQMLTGILTQTGLQVCSAKPKNVPDRYFASRISEHADLSPQLSHRMWIAFVEGLCRETLRLPGIQSRSQGKEAHLSLLKFAAVAARREEYGAAAQQAEPSADKLKRH